MVCDSTDSHRRYYQCTCCLFPLSFGGYPIIKIGIILFIFLPVARVILMLVLFLREHDYLYATIACFVLCTIAAGVFIEINLP